MYYGQHEEDRFIQEYFNHIGTCLEVGASHGTVSSNTLYFEQQGWTCICVEPNPVLYNFLKTSRKLHFNYALGAENKDEVDFNVVTLSNGDVTAISSLNLDSRLLETHPVIQTHIIKVNVRTVDWILEQAGVQNLDFASIDTEGTELDVLRGFDLDRWKPRLLVVEDNFESKELISYLALQDYRLDKRIAVNSFFVRNDFNYNAL